jgi:hypothetical protein
LVGPIPSEGPGQSGKPATAGELFTSAVQIATSVLGLAGYVYLIGGIVSWVRFGAARLPSDEAVSALDTRTLFAVDLRSIVFMALVFAVVSVVAYIAAGNWEVNGPDWHELIRHRGVGEATKRLQDPVRRTVRDSRRKGAQHFSRARRWDRVAKAAAAVGFHSIARHAEIRRGDAKAAAGNCGYAGRPGESPGVIGGPPAAVATPEELGASLAEIPPRIAPLGDRAVRIVAGFTNLVLSSVVGVLVARGAEWLTTAWWVVLIVWLLAALVVGVVLDHWGPLRWGPRVHGLAWVIVIVVALFVAAPLGLLVIAATVVSTLGRALGRVTKPETFSQLLRSPLPWALLTFYTLASLAYAATPPVSFQRAVVDTAGGQTVGGLLSRSGGDVYMVTCTPLADASSTNERVIVIAAANVKGLSLGGPNDIVDSGQRPSLAALGLNAAGVDAKPPTWFGINLRARAATCAGANPTLTAGTEDAALGYGAIVGPAPPGGQAHDGELPIERTSPPSIARLARKYQPTVELTTADRFWPVSVGAVLQDIGANGARTCLVTGATSTCPATLSDLTPATSRTSDYLRYPATVEPDPTNQFDAFERGQSIVPGSLHHWLADPGALHPWYTGQVYFYYAGPIGTSQWPARARNPAVASGLIGLEYWFFYPFNYYPTTVDSDLMRSAPLAGDKFNTDLHQGDWEHVVVLLDPHTLSPVWLYTARHADEGQFYPWTSPTLAFDDGHPIIQGAFGGHPSYDNRCGGRPRARVDDLSSDWLACGGGRFAFRATTTPLVDLARTDWACWKGHFGEAKPGLESNQLGEQDTVLTDAREFVYVAGPVSPLRQAENTGVCTGPGPMAAETAGAALLASHPPMKAGTGR